MSVKKFYEKHSTTDPDRIIIPKSCIGTVWVCKSQLESAHRGVVKEPLARRTRRLIDRQGWTNNSATVQASYREETGGGGERERETKNILKKVRTRSPLKKRMAKKEQHKKAKKTRKECPYILSPTRPES